jgi:hypothetical protein
VPVVLTKLCPGWAVALSEYPATGYSTGMSASKPGVVVSFHDDGKTSARRKEMG